MSIPDDKDHNDFWPWLGEEMAAKNTAIQSIPDPTASGSGSSIPAVVQVVPSHGSSNLSQAAKNALASMMMSMPSPPVFSGSSSGPPPVIQVVPTIKLRMPDKPDLLPKEVTPLEKAMKAETGFFSRALGKLLQRIAAL